MTYDEIEQIKAELLREYPGAAIKVAPDQAEIVAEIEPKRAVAVIQLSQPHFHREMTEVYRILRGTLYVVCGGVGHVLGVGQSLTIEPGKVHYARGAGGFAWLEVLSEPAWTSEDYHVL
jgi:mannose-6-phosphate isomerase-like protein (cupin superfamily)